MNTSLLNLNEEEIGKKYNMLTIIEIVEEERTSKKTGVERIDRLAVCSCDCGNIQYVAFSNVRNGNSKSCGCLSRTKDGDSYKELYYRWMTQYNYKGSEMEKEWQEFTVFEKWCKDNHFSSGDTVVRIDKKKNLGPANAKIEKLRKYNFKKKYIYYIVSPDGEDYMTDNLNDFCFKHELNPYMFNRVALTRATKSESSSNKYFSHLGWTVDSMHKDINKDVLTYEDQFFYPPTLS